MQKKLIALAIAGLMSAPAFAQSNVTMYGTIDFGYVSLGSGYIRNADRDSIKGRTALESGVAKANRIGVKGVEDLGNGLKAVFVLENGMTGDTQGQGFFNGTNRQSYAGLAGGFGTIAFGRQYTPQHLFTSAVDPFAKQGLGGAGNVLFQDRRLDNLTAYITPDSLGGFKLILGYAFNGLGDENMENNKDYRVYAVAPSFTWNNLFVGANYHSVKLNRDKGMASGTTAKGVSVLNTYDFYASYDFGVAKIGATAGRRTTKKKAIGTEKDSKITQFLVGATFKLTPNDSVLASYGRASESKVVTDGTRPRISQWALGYEHALTKRTALYAQVAFQSHNGAFRDGDGFHTAGDTGPVGGVTASYKPGFNGPDMSPATPYRRGFGLGMRHDF